MNIVVIGLGSMGKRRIRLLKKIFPDSYIIGIEKDDIKRVQAQEKFAISCYNNLEEIEPELDIESAFVCTSPLSHADIITECLLRGWHTFTEINLVTDYYDENIQLAKKMGVKLFLSSTPMYREEMCKIHRIVEENGKAINYNYHIGQYLPDWHPWESYQSFFVQNKKTNGCREIFAIELPWLIWCFGKIKKINLMSNRVSELRLPYNDSYFVQLLHQNGSIGSLVVDVVCRQAVRKLEIYNEDIYLEWNGVPVSLKQKNLVTQELENIGMNDYCLEEGYSEFINEFAYINEIKAFYNIEGAEIKYSFEEDKYVLGIIDEIERLGELTGN